MDFAAARKVMVDSQVRVNDVTNRALQAALLAAPRERLLPDDRAFEAYGEVDADLGDGRRLMIARDIGKLLQALDARPGETALAIAAPYAALALKGMGLNVSAQESSTAVAERVGPALAEAGVVLSTAPLAEPAGQDFDIVVSEGAVERRPDAWLAALKTGGRLAVVERKGPIGRAVLYVKGDHGVSRRDLFDASPAMLTELSQPEAFAL